MAAGNQIEDKSPRVVGASQTDGREPAREKALRDTGRDRQVSYDEDCGDLRSGGWGQHRRGVGAAHGLFESRQAAGVTRCRGATGAGLRSRRRLSADRGAALRLLRVVHHRERNVATVRVLRFIA